MPNALERGDLQRQISTAMKALKKEMADIGGANTPEMKAAGTVLAREIRKVLSVRGTKTNRSKPGEPPRRQKGRLAKSVGQDVVGGVRRVGESDFKSRLLQEGVDTSLPIKSGKRRRKGGTAKRRLKIEPRPFMERAAENAIPKMDGEFSLTLEKRIEGGGSAIVR